MEIAKIITNGNTRMVILPDDVFTDCEEVEIDREDRGIHLMPLSRPATEEEFKRVSDKLMKKNAEAYRELAK